MNSISTIFDSNIFWKFWFFLDARVVIKKENIHIVYFIMHFCLKSFIMKLWHHQVRFWYYWLVSKSIRIWICLGVEWRPTLRRGMEIICGNRMQKCGKFDSTLLFVIWKFGCRAELQKFAQGLRQLGVLARSFVGICGTNTPYSNLSFLFLF